ncbi:hypothetical protein Ddye_000698 [Dipteronia dyeriana]|uniref:HAT C-terminal dimerisation domain-containing protein n=1 Tax=Dipteronia dyeriana TaxID=168575 RepID=A0AAE0CSV1_9ROSI|nr:hypothetical protein Ddye_000698 [Dipteronia dyeriana]
MDNTKRILAFRVFDDAHTADNIYKNMKIIFEEYKIESKIFSIGFDNASNNMPTIPALIELCKPYLNSKFFHKKCACHVLNLCVQNGLEILQTFIKPIKDALSYLWKHLNVMKVWILATPISTVAVEQEFSVGENILDARRSILSLESIQVQVCVDDWTKAEYRQQEIEQEVIYDFFDDDHTTNTGTEVRLRLTNGHGEVPQGTIPVARFLADFIGTLRPPKSFAGIFLPIRKVEYIPRQKCRSLTRCLGISWGFLEGLGTSSSSYINVEILGLAGPSAAR